MEELKSSHNEVIEELEFRHNEAIDDLNDQLAYAKKRFEEQEKYLRDLIQQDSMQGIV